MNYYTRHLGDYAKDTKHLSLLEHGAYTVLMDWCYNSERPLPNDEALLYRICGAFAKTEQQAVMSVLEEFFESTEMGWLQGRVEKELQKAHEKSGKAKASALSRWTADALPTLNDGNADAMRTHSEGSKTRARFPITNNQEPRTSPPNPRQRGKSVKLTEAAFPADLPEGYEPPLKCWFAYKQERKESYTPSGWEALLTQQLRFPASSVAQSVEASMSNNWAGLFTDKLINPVDSKPGFGWQKKEGAAVAVIPEAPEPEWDWQALHVEKYGKTSDVRWCHLPKSQRFELRQAHEKKKGGAGDE